MNIYKKYLDTYYIEKANEFNGVMETLIFEVNNDFDESLFEVVSDYYYLDEKLRPATIRATQYSRDRKAEYDKLNQDEMRFDDLMNGTTTWIDAILAIKAKYPKPITQGE